MLASLRKAVFWILLGAFVGFMIALLKPRDRSEFSA